MKGRHGSGRQEVTCGIPQPLGVGLVDGVPGDAGVVSGTPGDDGRLVAVLEIAAADLVQQRGSGQQHGGSRALLDGLLPLLGGPQATGVLLQAGGDGAGVESVSVDTLAGPAARGFDSEQHVGGLGLAVGGEGVVGAEVEVQVVEDDRGPLVGAGPWSPTTPSPAATPKSACAC